MFRTCVSRVNKFPLSAFWCNVEPLKPRCTIMPVFLFTLQRFFASNEKQWDNRFRQRCTWRSLGTLDAPASLRRIAISNLSPTRVDKSSRHQRIFRRRFRLPEPHVPDQLFTDSETLSSDRFTEFLFCIGWQPWAAPAPTKWRPSRTPTLICNTPKNAQINGKTITRSKMNLRYTSKC